MKTTPNYGLKLPGENDFYNVGDFNDNFNAVDAALTAAEEHANNVANQAEANAKAHVDGMPWQRHKVSADDGTAIDISGHDLNNIVKTGFYKGTNLGNAPNLLYGWGYVEVITHVSSSWVLQKVYGLYADHFFMRRLTNTGWTPWTQDLYTWQRHKVSADDGNATMTGDLNADLSTGWYQVVDAPNAPSTGWFYVEVIRHDHWWCVQNAYRFDSHSYYRRLKISGKWYDWSPDLFQAEANAKEYANKKVANIKVPVKSVNGKTGEVRLTAADVGAETPKGAQQKANDALTAAKEHANNVANQAEANAKAHVDGMPWQRHKVSADDGTAIDISGHDLNNIVKTGFYKGTNLGNAPNLLYGWGYVEVITHVSSSWVLQKVYGLYADHFFMRRLTNTGWTPWTQDLYTWQRHKVSADDGNATMTGDLNADLSTGWYQVVDAPNAPSTGWFWVEVIRHDHWWCVQNAYDFVSHSYYQRKKLNGNWTSWRNIVAELDQVKQSGVELKNKLVGAINANGVPASANDDFATLAAKIGQVGLKWAKGTAIVTDFSGFEVTGLSFCPKAIIMKIIGTYGYMHTVSAYSEEINLNVYLHSTDRHDKWVKDVYTPTPNGFKFDIRSSIYTQEFEWYAIG